MAEMAVPDGVWTFNGETLRIVPGSGRDVHELRKTLGELVIPIEAIAGATFEPSRKGGHLRLRLRKGADPLTDAVAGSLTAPADPYRLAVPKGRTGAAEYFADEMRDVLTVWQTPSGPSEEFLLPGPAVPITASETETVLRHLAELGELHRSGVLTDEEFSTAKQALLRRLE